MKTTIIIAALLTAIGASAAHAQLSMVTTRPTLSADAATSVSDEIDWGQLNVLPSFQQPISGPQRFESYLDGIRGSIGEKGSPLFVEKQFSNNGHYGNDAITADFAPGDWVLASAGFNSINASPPPRILISFQQPVHFVGTQLGRPNVAGSFTASVQAFNKNTLIGTFSRNGSTTASGDNSAIFLGVMDTEAVITDAIYTATDPTESP